MDTCSSQQKQQTILLLQTHLSLLEIGGLLSQGKKLAVGFRFTTEELKETLLLLRVLGQLKAQDQKIGQLYKANSALAIQTPCGPPCIADAQDHGAKETQDRSVEKED